MHKFTRFLAVLAAAAVCGGVTYLTMGASVMTIAYNSGVLAVMLIIILTAELFGFRRMRQTVRGLEQASDTLISIYQNKSELSEVTKAGAKIFGVDYLDRKYQEYLGFLRKTNTPCDIGDYIGEYEINNYTHRRLVEMVPDVLTSLGILGTFIGLVWGLKGFNPVSYEAMASSITSLIDGIKVAFVTSIYGIALSLAYTYCERDALTGLSESLDNFVDKYYLCAVSPTDTSAMRHVLSNQKKQVQAIELMGENISGQIAESLTNHMDPMIMQMSAAVEHFTDAVADSQQEIMERVAGQMMSAMRREFVSEFREMREILKESNKTQAAVNSQVAATLKERDEWQKQLAEQIADQQEYTAQFAGYMNDTMKAVKESQIQQQKMTQILAQQVEQIEKLSSDSVRSARAAREAAQDAVNTTPHTTIEDLEELTERLDRVIDLMERQQRAQKNAKRGLFR